MSTFYLDYENGNDSNNGSTWDLAWKTLTTGASAARIAPGDIIKIAKSPDPYSIGNATWTYNSAIVTLATAQTANIDLCEGAWTGTANVTCSTTNYYGKHGSYSTQIAIAAAFTTGLVAYHTIDETNFSSYQTISLNIRNSLAIVADRLRLCLCSDTAGETVVDSFSIPAIASTNGFVAVTIAKSGGGNLGSSIKSIALYADVDPGTLTLQFDNILACKAGGLNLQSLISKNPLAQRGTEGWYGIRYINGTEIGLDGYPNLGLGLYLNYGGETKTVATYARETIKTALASTDTSQVQTLTDSGTAASFIEYQGGYNRSTGKQDGETFFDGLNGRGYGLYSSGKSYNLINMLNFVRYGYGMYIVKPTVININASNINNNAGSGLYITGTMYNSSIIVGNALMNGYFAGYGVNLAASGANEYSNNNTIIIGNTSGNSTGVYFNQNLVNSNIKLKYSNCNRSYGLQMDRCNRNNVNLNGTMNNNGSYGLYLISSSANYFKNPVVQSSTNGKSIYNNDGENSFYNATISETKLTGFSPYANAFIFSESEGSADKHFIYSDGGYVETVEVSGGTGWRIYPTSNTRTSAYPFPITLATIYCVADRPVHVSALVQKSHATDIGAKLICEGGQIAGVDSDVVDTKANDTNEELLTLDFTPTASGIVKIKFLGYWLANTADEYVTLRSLKTNARKYGKVFLGDEKAVQNFNYILKYNSETDNPFITESDEETVADYGGIIIDHENAEITITEAHSIEELYDYCQYNLTQNLNETDFFTTIDGVNYTSIYDITVDGCTLSGSGKRINMPTKTFSAVNGGGTSATINDINGIMVGFTITGLIAGSEIHIFNDETDEDDEEELAGSENTGTSFTYNYTWTSDIPIYVVVGKAGRKWLRLDNLTLTDTNQSIPVFQQIDLNYTNPS